MADCRSFAPYFPAYHLPPIHTLSQLLNVSGLALILCSQVSSLFLCHGEERGLAGPQQLIAQ